MFVAQKLMKYAISTARLLVLLSICFVILYQLFSKISVSFMSVTDLYDAAVVYIPKHFTWSNYKSVMEQVGYFKAVLKTGAFTLLVAFLQVASSLLAGYGFARFNFRGKNLFFAFAILTLIIPSQNIMAPLYFQFQNFNFWGLLGDNGFNLLNTAWPIVLMSTTCMGLNNCIYIYMFRQYFKGFPKELEESGQIDGASTFVIFTRIILPSATAMIATAFLFSFVWQWTDTFYVNTFMPGNDFLAVQLQSVPRILGNTDSYKLKILSNTSIILLVLPILLIFLFAQRYFVESIERSGLVG